MNKKIFLLSLLVLSGVFYVLNTPVVLADDISPASINWLHTNVGGWSVTSTITKVDITSDTICIYHTKAGQWPPSQFDTIQIEGNPWIFAKINGQWHGATWDWLRVGQQCKGMTAIEIGKDQIRIPPLDSSWVPQQGDQIGFMMSARARDDVRTVTERSDIVVVTWPYSSGGGGGTQPPIQPSNLPTVPAVPPVITGFNPTSAVPGQSVEVYGTNLSNKIKLVAGSTSRDVESSADNQLTTSTFEVPSDIAQGTYKISVTNSKGTATSTQSLTVKVGGPPFLNPVSPPVPTKGLPTNLGQLIQQIFTWSLGILGISVFVMFFYSGFLYLTAAGNTVKTGEARQHMTNAIFGAILLLSSYLILYTINPDFVKNTFNLPGLGKAPSASTPTTGGAGSFPPADARTKHGDGTAVIAQAKANLQTQGIDLSGPCGAFAIVNEAAKGLGAGLLSKSGGNMCQGFATDIIAFPDGYIYDVLIDGGGANTPTWRATACPNAPTCPADYRPAF